MKRISCLPWTLLLALPLFVSLTACGAQTAGHRVSYKAAFAGAVSKGTIQEFTNKHGWKIQLQEAKLLVGPLYFYSGEPRASLWQQWFGVNAAAACPTHAQFDNGQVLGEVQNQIVVDLLSPTPTPLGTIEGIEGHMQSMELHLHPPGTLEQSNVEDLPTKLQGATLYMSGRASNDTEGVPFKVSFVIPDTGTMRIIESISSNVKLEEDSVQKGSLVLQVYLDKWFTNVNFATVGQQNRSGETMLDASNLALLQGVRSRYAYGAVWKQ